MEIGPAPSWPRIQHGRLESGAHKSSASGLNSAVALVARAKIDRFQKGRGLAWDMWNAKSALGPTRLSRCFAESWHTERRRDQRRSSQLGLKHAYPPCPEN